MSEPCLTYRRIHKALEKIACGGTKFPTIVSVIETLKTVELKKIVGLLSYREFSYFAVNLFQDNSVEFVKFTEFSAVYAVFIPVYAKRIMALEECSF